MQTGMQTGMHWMSGVAAGALVALSVLTVAIRGQVVADRYALAQNARECARWDRHLRALDVRLTQIVANMARPGTTVVPAEAATAAPLWEGP